MNTTCPVCNGVGCDPLDAILCWVTVPFCGHCGGAGEIAIKQNRSPEAFAQTVVDRSKTTEPEKAI